jgi:UDP-glucose 4-epimerase
MNIIVTGGAGFIGSHLVERLHRDNNIKKIIILDNFEDGSYKNIRHLQSIKKIKSIKKDVTRIKKNDKVFKKIDLVIHLAAIADVVPSIESPKDYCETNVIGTMNILEAMRYNKIKKIIYSASSSCYGIPTKYPTNEKAKIDPKYPYAFSKYVGELFIQHWSKVYNINYISLRLFNVYGTRSRTTGAYGAVMGVFLKQKIEGRPLTLVGSGKQSRDFIYVSDVCDAFIKSIYTSQKNLILNIGNSRPIKIIDLVKTLKSKYVKVPNRPGEPFKTYADIKLAKKKINWKPKIQFNVGIKKLLDNLDYWKKAPLWTPLKIKLTTKLWFKYLK